jgi:hypothetical protein
MTTLLGGLTKVPELLQGKANRAQPFFHFLAN